MTRTTKRYLIGSVAVVGVLVAVLVEERVRGHLALRTWERGMRARGERLTIAELAPPITNTGVRVLTSGQFQVMRDEAVLTHQMVRAAVAENALGGMLWQALQAEGWSDGQLATIQNAWEPSGFLPARGMAGGSRGARSGTARHGAARLDERGAAALPPQR